MGAANTKRRLNGSTRLDDGIAADILWVVGSITIMAFAFVFSIALLTFLTILSLLMIIACSTIKPFVGAKTGSDHDFCLTVRVGLRGGMLAAEIDYSRHAATERGSLSIGDHVDADLAADEVVGRLVGKTPLGKSPHSQMSSSARSREAFRRYMQ